ncbi:MAG: ABC transporter permease [Candidatus Methanoperedens sp.]|jgi:putative ABC transport system permease protein|nr:ABC transporter permease [Candidatus Methanoperedens sp.]PKL53803.1 MAG: ABC transporter permease [Candidatus Methanoperedenaceae archaeon HGW-Methanoperedenaceae-1]
MKNIDIFRLSLSHVKKSKMRSWLTIIGIVIGVAAIVAIISIGEGMQASVQANLGSLGADLMTVTPGFSRATGFGGGHSSGGGVSSETLTDKDLNVIKQVSGVLYANGMVSGRSEMIIGTEKTSVSISGVDTSVWRAMVTTDLEAGRLLQPGDSNAVVIGYSLAHDVFLQPVTQNRPVIIGGKTFKIVGIFTESGGFGGTDNAVYMPADSARDVVTENVSRNQFTSITVKIADQSLVDSVKADIEQKLMMSRHVNPRTKDFTVTAFASIQQQISSVTQSISMFLAAIAAVSLLVGAVGIANTMFMSVMERTRQIGLLKALGATDNEVMRLFLMESGLFGVVGGVIGITTGILISVLISSVGLRMIGPGGTMTTVIPPQLIFFALTFSILVGVISGVVPARNAAKMKPVDALRFEQ